MNHSRRSQSASPVPTRHLITAKWPGKCMLCGCAYMKGDQVWYTPALAKGSVVDAALITHQAGECGSSYILHLVYATTRTRRTVHALNVDEVIAHGQKLMRKRSPSTGTILAIEVWQGNVRVV